MKLSSIILITIIWFLLILGVFLYNTYSIPTVCCDIEKNKCGAECRLPLHFDGYANNFIYIGVIPSIILILIGIILNFKNKHK